MAWTAPRTWVAGEIVTASIMNTHIRDNLLEVIQRGGSVSLTANWDAGSFEIRAETFESDVTTGTAPLTIASTTVVTNLNADLVDGQSRAININADHTHQSTGAEAGKLDHGLALDGLTDDDHTQYQKESLLTTAGDVPYATASSTWARLPIGTANQLLRTNAGATAPEWATISAPTVVQKTSDEIVNNNITLQSDDELVLAVGANEKWWITLFLLFTSTAVANIKFDITTPAASSIHIFQSAPGTGQALTPGSTPWSETGTGADVYIYYHLFYSGGANAGNVQLRWAQDTAEASDTKIYAQSFLLAHKIG